ncbi:unnamed protein product [Symbiodinium pilosum]|uniref:Uncharacterized protein n=1 Tax=Symbiodinium pilosum TaxID=2952 RepID=A0A812R3S3_SYMPI|nr:unnamed protein product [Symbiodinium pilosum]
MRSPWLACLRFAVYVAPVEVATAPARPVDSERLAALAAPRRPSEPHDRTPSKEPTKRRRRKRSKLRLLALVQSRVEGEESGQEATAAAEEEDDSADGDDDEAPAALLTPPAAELRTEEILLAEAAAPALRHEEEEQQEVEVREKSPPAACALEDRGELGSLQMGLKERVEVGAPPMQLPDVVPGTFDFD